MASTAQQRRDQRRRLVVSWNRSTSAAGASSETVTRTMAAYAADALPERQRGPAVLLPTGVGGLTLASLAILLPMAGAIAVAVSEVVLGRPLFATEGRFNRTLAALGACFDQRAAANLQLWLADVSLLLAAAVAAVVRLMRRHRQDDYNGRYRAWGWLATLFVVASCAGVVPLGGLVGAALADATGIALGPGGIGWWIVLAATALAGVSLWAVIPLHERAATATWLVLALGMWATAGAAEWVWAGHQTALVAGRSAWALGAALMAVAMLVAARSVIREVRGQCGRAAKPDAGRNRTAVAAPATDTGADANADGRDRESGDEQASSGDETVYVDGSEHDNRHLSKAERKRLRKLARMNGAAA
jgi:hypothetical protein